MQCTSGIKAGLRRRVGAVGTGELAHALCPFDSVIEIVENGEGIQLVRGNDDLECVDLKMTIHVNDNKK